MSFLKNLRKLSVERCEKYFFKLNDWNVLEWAGAMCGEAGETANFAKKIQRIRTMLRYSKNQNDGRQLKKIDNLKKELGKEVADTIIYLDLLCASEGIDLEEAIRSKFNEVSKKHKFNKTL